VSGATGPGDSGACPWDDLLSALLDSELHEAEAQQVHAHVELHPACKSELGELSRLRQMVRTLPLRSGSPAFWLRVMDEVAADRPASMPAPASMASPPRSPAVASGSRPAELPRWRRASFAASVLVVAAGLAGTRGGGQQTTDPSSTFPDSTVERAGVIAGITRPSTAVSTTGALGDRSDDRASTPSTSDARDGWLQELADAINDVLR
jgi:anti-sigma factor RsiW